MSGADHDVMIAVAILLALSVLMWIRRLSLENWRGVLWLTLKVAGLFILLALEFFAVVMIVAFAFVGIKP